MNTSWITRFRGNAPKGLRLFVIGSQGAGKTCFLGGLSLLTDAAHPSRFELIGRPDEDEGGANSSMEFLNDVGDILRSGEWPQATVSALLLRYELRYQGFASHLDLLDYPGEEMQSALNSLAPNRFDRFSEALRDATHLLVLVDPMIDLQIDEDVGEPAEPANQQIHRRLRAPVNALHWCISNRGEDARPPHVGLVITKADLVPGLLDPGGCERLRSRVFEILRDRLEGLARDQVGVFAISAVGAVSGAEDIDEQGRVTSRTIPGGDDGLHPHGYERLFAWIFRRQLREQRRHKVMLFATVALLLGVILAALGWTEHSRIQVVNDALSPVIKRVKACAGVWTSWGCDARHKFINTELDYLKGKADVVVRYEDCEPLLTDLATLRKAADTRETDRIDDLDKKVGQRQRELELEGIIAMPAGPAREDRLKRFIATNPETDQAKEARSVLGEGVDTRMVERRRELSRSYPLITLSDFGAKATAMEKFVEEFRNKIPDCEDVLKAAKVSRRLAESGGSFELKISGFSGLAKPRYHFVKISSGSDGITFKNPPQKTKETNESTVQSIKWKPNDLVRVEVQVDVGWFFDDWAIPAAKEIKTPLSIALLGQGKLALEKTSDVARVPDLIESSVRVSVHGYDTADWELARKYIFPGESW